MADAFDNEDEQKKLDAVAEKLKLREVSDLRKVFAMPEGRRFLHRLAYEVCRLREPYFSTNALAMGNLAGRREVGQFIEREIEDRIGLDGLFQMKREAINDKLLRQAERKEIQGETDG